MSLGCPSAEARPLTHPENCQRELGLADVNSWTCPRTCWPGIGRSWPVHAEELPSELALRGCLFPAQQCPLAPLWVRAQRWCVGRGQASRTPSAARRLLLSSQQSRLQRGALSRGSSALAGRSAESLLWFRRLSPDGTCQGKALSLCFYRKLLIPSYCSLLLQGRKVSHGVSYWPEEIRGEITCRGTLPWQPSARQPGRSRAKSSQIC